MSPVVRLWARLQMAPSKQILSEQCDGLLCLLLANAKEQIEENEPRLLLGSMIMQNCESLPFAGLSKPRKVTFMDHPSQNPPSNTATGHISWEILLVLLF